MIKEKKSSEIVIIGCGIAGMSCSLYLQRAGIQPLILGDLGLSSLVNSPEVKNYPGIQKISGVDLLFSMQSQIVSMKNVEIINDYCNALKIESDHLSIETEEFQIATKNVIVASGRRPKLLNIPNEQLFLGNGISFCAYCDGDLYAGKQVAIIGGGNSAIDEAVYLSKIVDHVDVIVRKDHLRSEVPKSFLDSFKNISIKFNTEIHDVIEMNGRMKAMFSQNESKEYDGLFYAIGQTPNTGFMPDDLIDESGYITNDLNDLSNGCHILAAGDVSKNNIHKQAITAAADGASKALYLIEHRII